MLTCLRLGSKLHINISYATAIHLICFFPFFFFFKEFCYLPRQKSKEKIYIYMCARAYVSISSKLGKHAIPSTLKIYMGKHQNTTTTGEKKKSSFVNWHWGWWKRARWGVHLWDSELILWDVNVQPKYHTMRKNPWHENQLLL